MTTDTKTGRAGFWDTATGEGIIKFFVGMISLPIVLVLRAFAIFCWTLVYVIVFVRMVNHYKAQIAAILLAVAAFMVWGTL